MERTKKIRPKTKALYTIQFIKGRDGTPWLIETGNSTGKDGVIDFRIDMMRFGRILAQNHKSKKSMLLGKERDALALFCKSYHEEINKGTKLT